ncbi:MAG: SCO family protein [Chloroflexota bacterium]|nr:SCO family protein [Chloroflexota bacterium]
MFSVGRATRGTVLGSLHIVFLLALLILSLLPPPVLAGDPAQEKFINEVAFDQRLNAQVPLDLPFRDEDGNSVRLTDFFSQKPVILLLGYYECPNLCPLTRDGLVKSLSAIDDFDIGQEYDLLVVSIDPTEGSAVAEHTKRQYVAWYDRPTAEQGMHFLTGEKEEIEALSKAVGFRYGYDTEREQYAHASGITILTPQGKIARYAFGIEYDPSDLRLALIDAASSKIGSAIDQLILLCFQYDPQVGKYTLAIVNVLRLAGIVTVVVLGAAIALLLRRGSGGNPPGPPQKAVV